MRQENDLQSRWRQTVLGIVLGLAASAVVLVLWPERTALSVAHHRGRLLSDCDGPIQDLVIHYLNDAAETIVPVYGPFLRQLPSTVQVHVVCPSRSDFDRLAVEVGSTSCALLPVIVNHPMTCWSRDRWLAIRVPSSGGQTDVMQLCSPRMEQAADVWLARSGDARTAADLAAAGLGVAAKRSALFFDGGDFVADEETIFVTPRVLRHNLQSTVSNRDELVRILTKLVGRRVVLLNAAPPHHAGMFMMPVGERTMLVGDPSAAQVLVRSVPPTEIGLPGGIDFSEETQAAFDAVAHQCQQNGYCVVRIPVAPASDGRTYLTYVNVILDDRDGRQVVYMPTFSHVPRLNEAAASVWHSLGYQVRPVPCDTCYQHFGSLRCLVNVLRRGRTSVGDRPKSTGDSS